MTPRQKLWQHMHDEHGLLLLGSELEEIIMLAKEIIELDVLSESNANHERSERSGDTLQDFVRPSESGGEK